MNSSTTWTLQSAAGATGNGSQISCRESASIGVQVSGTFVGTVTFEGTVDDTNWVSVQGMNVADGSLSTTATAPGVYIFASAGLSYFRARISAWTSGSITVYGVWSALSPGSMYDVAAVLGANSGVDIGDVTINNASGASAVNVQDGGNAISIDDNSSTISIDDGSGSITVDGAITLSSAIAITQTPTVTAGGYSAADAVGGKLTFANAAASTGGGGIIQTVVITDLAKQDAALDLVLFDTDFTADTDNAAFDIEDADLPNVIGHVAISAADYCDSNDSSFATVNNVGLGFKAVATSIYGQLCCRTAPTYASTQDITVQLFIVRE